MEDSMVGGCTEQAGVEAAVQALRTLMIEPDRARLEALACETLSYGHSNGWVETRDEFVANLLSGASDFVSIALSKQTVQIYGDTAIVRHDLDAHTNDGGKPAQVALHVMLVWLHRDGGWRLAARQAARRPA